jgi:DNA-binding transcriptional ArsR family regulator
VRRTRQARWRGPRSASPILAVLPSSEAEALSVAEITARLGGAERTVSRHLADMRRDEEGLSDASRRHCSPLGKTSVIWTRTIDVGSPAGCFTRS